MCNLSYAKYVDNSFKLSKRTISVEYGLALAQIAFIRLDNWFSVIAIASASEPVWNKRTFESYDP